MKIPRYPCSILLACVFLLLAFTAAAERPNVLLILSDDQGYGDLSLHDNPHLRTPNLDKLGRNSVRFDRFYVSSVCAPTRASLLTGRWPLRTGCHGVTHNRETMLDSEVTIAEALSGAGYRNGCFGKWHNGSHYPFTPQGQGFETFFGYLAHAAPHAPLQAPQPLIEKYKARLKGQVDEPVAVIYAMIEQMDIGL
ncbi:MAG: sulfatase-like hydrolase/transferase [Kiritimatiellae bacterium]|jgi:arylsulfatase A-like enzyme|nr:sulfatase-like hydrolase/transferase [Kiritimatiellia bacterium]